MWLRAHPHRDEKWLQDRLTEGFDIHHLDGNKYNNQLDNLVLIEHSDHMYLHGMGRTIGRLNTSGRNRKPRRLPRKTIDLLVSEHTKMAKKLGAVERRKMRQSLMLEELKANGSL